MKNKKDIVPQTLILPVDLILQILLRLPVRSLSLCKCVCKLWYSIISDPQFAESHFDMALAPPTHRIFMKSNHRGDVHFITVDTDAPLHSNSSKVIFDIPLPSPVPTYGCPVRFMGSCRGLMLLTNDYRGLMDPLNEFVVWNPSTGFQKRIKHGVAMHAHLFGFGYDSSMDDYLIVTFTWRSVRTKGFWKSMEVDWFSFRTNSWTRMVDTGVYYHAFEYISFRTPGQFLNDALHWVVESMDRPVLIIAFDMRERRISEIPLPSELAIVLKSNSASLIANLIVMRGCLCISYVESGYGTAMWTMKQYKVHSSWIETLVPFFPDPNGDVLKFAFYPMCSTRSDLVFGSNNMPSYKIGLVTLNDKSELLELLTLGRSEYGLLFCVHRESLLSLPGEFEKATEF